MIYTVVVVNMKVGEAHPDRSFRNMDELELYCDTEYPGWTSLVVTVLPRTNVCRDIGMGIPLRRE